MPKPGWWKEWSYQYPPFWLMIATTGMTQLQYVHKYRTTVVQVCIRTVVQLG